MEDVYSTVIASAGEKGPFWCEIDFTDGLSLVLK